MLYLWNVAWCQHNFETWKKKFALELFFGAINCWEKEGHSKQFTPFYPDEDYGI